MTILETVTSVKKESPGRKHLIRHLKGERLTLKQAVIANCFGCMGYYVDGRNDCGMPECPLYGWMPYRKDKTKGKRKPTEKQIEAGCRLAKFYPQTSRKTQNGHIKAQGSGLLPLKNYKRHFNT